MCVLVTSRVHSLSYQYYCMNLQSRIHIINFSHTLQSLTSCLFLSSSCRFSSAFCLRRRSNSSCNFCSADFNSDSLSFTCIYKDGKGEEEGSMKMRLGIECTTERAKEWRKDSIGDTGERGKSGQDREKEGRG